MREIIMKSPASLICHLDQARYTSLHVKFPESDAVAISIAVPIPVQDFAARED